MFLQIQLEVVSPRKKKRAPPIIQVRLLKRRRRYVKVDPKLGGQWKEKEKVLGLVANGRRRRRFFSTSSTFPPSNFT
jgi:hypothetical protein